jgi:hypothetical protein
LPCFVPFFSSIPFIVVSTEFCEFYSLCLICFIYLFLPCFPLLQNELVAQLPLHVRWTLTFDVGNIFVLRSNLNVKIRLETADFFKTSIRLNHATYPTKLILVVIDIRTSNFRFEHDQSTYVFRLFPENCAFKFSVMKGFQRLGTVIRPVCRLFD